MMPTQEYIDGRVRRLGELYLPAVRQLAVPDDRADELWPIGSCVLLWHRGHQYLFTAAHVLDLYPGRNPWLGTATTWIEVSLPFQLLKKRDAEGDADTIDIAYKRLDPSLAGTFDGCSFLTGDQVAHSVETTFEPPQRSKYTALGWPNNKFKYLRASRSTSPTNLGVTGVTMQPSDYQQVSIRPDTHIAMEFDQKRMYSPEGPKQAPSVEGLSGGGIFTMPGLDHPGDVAVPQLVAITLQQEPSSRLLFGVRLGAVFRTLDYLNVAT